MDEIREAAIETGQAAVRVTRMLERSIQLLESQSWDQRISSMTDPAKEVVNFVFWRAVVLICLLMVGIGLLRLVPKRKAEGRDE